ncbi:hypothetical protein NIES2100_05320 [Calothrix sp. NIES-2100]|uniref:hypothetical protein n=1 Tax=Calothrix sp. NIES-2100 TaxID=1954172 RepID=UPI000B61B6DC|nr:hypothetical protein NIES2100_05320 [Calothrix sp. NIES-2100]
MRKSTFTLTRYIRSTFPNLPNNRLKIVERSCKLAAVDESYSAYDVINSLNNCNWYCFDANSSFTDTSGTTPATTNSAIACVKPWIGSGNITQSTSSKRPTLLSDGASFNSTNLTFLIGSTNLSNTNYSAFVVANVTANSKGAIFANQNDANNITAGWFLGVGSTTPDTNGNNLLGGSSGTGGGFITSSFNCTGSKKLLGMTRNNTDSTIRLYGNNITTTVGSNNTYPSNSITGGFQVGGYFRSTGSINRHCDSIIYSVITGNFQMQGSTLRRITKFLNFYHSLGLTL